MEKQVRIEHKSYIDAETGEIHNVSVFIKQANNTGFEMIFYGHLLDILNDLGNKKIQVLSHIVKNRIVGKNIYIGTIIEIAKRVGVNKETVVATLKELENKGVIKRKTGVIYIDPNLIVDGRYRNKIMYEYRQMDDKDKKDIQHANFDFNEELSLTMKKIRKKTK